MSTRTPFLHAWVRNTILAYLLGLAVLHPTIAHGITGSHGKELSPAQFAMHTVSLAVFGLLLCVAQNRALRLLQPGRSAWHGIAPFLLLPAPFWLGYYAFYVPFDILFMLLSIGAINAVLLRPFVRAPRHWMWQIMLTMIAAATAGIAGGVLMYFNVTKGMTSIAGDYLMWLAISAPAAFVCAPLSRWFLRRQTAPSSAPRAGEVRPFMMGIQDSMHAPWLSEGRNPAGE